MSRLAKLRSLPREERGLDLEAVWRLALARLAIGLLSFRRVRRLLTPSAASGADDGGDPGRRELARRIGRSVRATANHLPWSCRCLVQALAAKAMLDRRHIASRVFVGVAQDETQALRSHAWLRVGDLFVTGREGHEHYRVITDFRAEHLK